MTDMPTAADLVGAWRLDNWRISFSDDRPDTYPYGDDAKGYLIYEASGRMAVMVSNADRPQLSDANIRRAPVEETVAAVDSFFGYSGTWRREGDHMVHSVEMAL
ncbi:MAG: lipocalin-like domain-containing protein, partial [Dehalococcoidia bacterium]